MKEIQKGDKVIYTTRERKEYKGIIASEFERHGIKCFDVKLENGENRWGYENQFRLQ